MRSAHVWLEADGKNYELAREEFPGNALTGASLDLERQIKVVVKPKELGPARRPGDAARRGDRLLLAVDNVCGRRRPAHDRHQAAARLAADGLTYVRGRLGARDLHRRGRRREARHRGRRRFFRGYVDPRDPKRMLAFYAIPADAPGRREAGARGGATAPATRRASRSSTNMHRPRLPRRHDRAHRPVHERQGERSCSTGFSRHAARRLPEDQPRDAQGERRPARRADRKKSSVDRIWAGAFVQMPNAHAGAKFAERRSYVYDGKVVDQQTHMGYDFASTSHADVPAANDGVVVFAGPLGIYGNTVIVDHGLGLFSLYGHLSEIAVEKHQPVAKGEYAGQERHHRPRGRRPPALRDAARRRASSIRWSGSTRNGSTTTSRASSRRGRDALSARGRDARARGVTPFGDGCSPGTARAARPALAAHARSVPDLAVRDDAAADPRRHGGAVLRALPRALSRRSTRSRPPTRRTCCGSGRASATTRARATCSARRRWSCASTAASCRARPRRWRRCPVSAATRSARCAASPSSEPRGDRRRERAARAVAAVRGERELADTTRGGSPASSSPRREPGEFNQALMELGATVCTPRKPGVPRAARSPTVCDARASGRPSASPRPRVKAAAARVHAVGGVLVRRGRVLLAAPAVARPARRALGAADVRGHGSRRAGRGRARAHRARASRPARALGQVRHLFTHRDLPLELVRARGPRRPPRAASPRRPLLQPGRPRRPCRSRA